MHPPLKCNPGDIVTEFLGESVAAKYIVLAMNICATPP